MATVSLLATKSETGFQSFVPTIHHWEINPDMEVHQNLMKML